MPGAAPFTLPLWLAVSAGVAVGLHPDGRPVGAVVVAVWLAGNIGGAMTGWDTMKQALHKLPSSLAQPPRHPPSRLWPLRMSASSAGSLSVRCSTSSASLIHTSPRCPASMERRSG